MHGRKLVAVGLLCCLVLFGVGATAQEEPAKDHPSVPRFPGMLMESGKETDFDAAEFPLGADKTKRVEGRNWQFTYTLKEGARQPSPLEIIRNYANQFKARGGKVLFQQADSGGGAATMMMPLGAGERWLKLEVSNDGTNVMMAIIETAAMKQKLEFSADEMAEQLKSAGKVTLRGILFDTAKTDIKPESNGLLDEVAAMLKANGDLKLRIEGHTDNAGGKASNLQLSKGRATAVKTAMVSRGISADRLSTEGFGDTRPVADNNSADGRAQNRRVELVKQ